MNFSTDRDLLALEPRVFNDVPYASQQRLRVTDAASDGTTVTSVGADFVTAGVDPAGVVLINDLPHEVIVRTDANTLGVSLLRTGLSDPAIPGEVGNGLELIARTFAPQAALVHDGLLRLLDIDEDDPDGELTEDAIVSLSVLARLEALGALERIYSGAAALVGDNDVPLLKAGEYRRRFREACARATVLIDTDGDGHADERRHLGVMRYTRV